MDKILIHNLHIQGILGVNDGERKEPREIVVTVSLFTNTKDAAHSDDISDCVDYSLVSKNIRALVESARRYTVEALAEDIANTCLRTPRVQKVTVLVEKPGAVINAESVGVEIERGT